MAAKHQLRYALTTLLKHNKDGSFVTQANRREILLQMAETLNSHGYKLKHPNGLKQKHIRFLNQYWQQQGLSAGTCKNRNSHLRWLCNKIGKPSVMLSNTALGVPNRQYATKQNKATELTQENANKITDPYIKVSVHLQRYFGLRREECLKIRPYQADKGTHLLLQASWCKGGRPRIVPIETKEARYWLDEAKKLVKTQKDSLIPSHKTYIQQRHLYDSQIQRAGIKRGHGLRHTYAQERYKALTGWECPAKGGPTYKQLTPEQKEKDHHARSLISELLGHSRIQVTVSYLSR